jgi:hypothetical protein
MHATIRELVEQIIGELSPAVLNQSEEMRKILLADCERYEKISDDDHQRKEILYTQIMNTAEKLRHTNNKINNLLDELLE